MNALLFSMERAWALPAFALIPLFGGVMLLLLRKHINIRDGSSIVTGLLTAAAVLSLWPHANSGLQFELWQWLPGLSLRFELEPLGLLFASLAACLWPVTTLYAIGYMRGAGEANQSRFYFFFAVAIAAALGIAFAGNGLTLFLFYEILTLSTYPLVAHKGTAEARRGARIYLGILLTTSIGLLLPALIWTHALAGHTDFVAGGILAGTAGPATLALLFAMFVFGIGKAATMPFHRWLPAAMVAPTPVSALLHAVAVVKAGVFSVLKVSIYLFGLDTLSLAGASEFMLWVAAFTLLAASFTALRQDNLKARLAYSTISQLAYIVVGASLATQAAALGGALHMVMHGAAKITLFFCAGAIYVAAHKTRVSELDGLGRAMPFTFVAFFIASLGIIGLPPAGGLWSKFLLMQGAADAEQMLIIGVLMVSSLLSIAYLLPIPVRAFFRPATPGTPPGHEAPWPSVLALCITAALSLALFFFPDPIIAPLAAALEMAR